ncbi:YSIRK-type signal peptide-containing protein [Staphylococcus simulans]|nr:YSIRK-type signal peptide-containing protein [Staphylococcus simulans]
MSRLKDEHTSKNKASFQPDRKNKYSIRKFTVGTASILVGAILLFGVNTQDAKAAETSTTSTVNATTPDKDTNVEVNHADAVVNETAVTTSSETRTLDETKEVPKTEVESLPTKASNDSTEKATSDHQEVVAPTVEKEATAAPKSQEVSTETAPFETNTTVQKVAETPKVEVPQSILGIQQVQDLNTAAEFYAQSSGVSIEEAQTLIQELNLDSQATPEEIQQALLYQLSHEYETWYKPAVREDLTTEAEQVADNPDFVKYAVTLPIEPIIIDADAIKNGYVRSGSDELSKTNLISGRAWMADQGIPSVGTNGLAPVPVNTPVYLQWMDKDGSISPIYRAYTHNKNRDDSAQDGPGAFAFDLRQGWTDATGKHHVYKAFKGQKYRFAIPDFTLPNGNKATMLRQAGGFYPGVFVDTFTDNNMGQTPVVGKNIGRTGIFMAEVPVGNYMTKPKNQWITSEGNHSYPELLAVDGYNVVRGKVWIESSGGDRANSATGPNYNPNLGDRVAAGYKVVLSSLTSQGAAAYRNEVQRVPVHERAAAAKRLLTAHPEYISATVVSVVDGNGVYAAKFPNGTLDVDHIYGFVLNTKGKLVQTYSGFTSPEFRKANQNISFVPISAPYSGVQQWANVNFAVVLSPSDTIDLHTVPYNATDNPAAPGSRVNVKLPNGDVPPMPTHIEWRDPSGQTVHRAPDFTTPKRGEQVSGFTIPKEAQEGDIYTAVLVSGGNDIAGSSVIVHITEANKYPPKAQTVTKEFGQPATEEDVMSHVTFPKYPTHLKKPTITIDHPDKLPDGNTPGKVLVPVTVTYPDGSVAHVNVPVVTKAQSDKDKYTPTAGSVEKDFGHKATPGEITGKVSVPDFPTGGNQPTYTVDETTIPDGQTPGTVNVPVTVHYPDNSSEVIEVPVTTKVQPDNDKYQPTTEAIHKPFGQKTDENEVKSKVSVPNFPGNGNQPTYTIDTSKIPDGQTPGTVNVPVTVQYPDGTSEVVNVPVITGPKDSDTYQPTTGEITKPYGQATTEQEVKDKVTVPNFPKDKGTPTITVDTSKLPNGQTSGEFQVPVTVTYPDKTTDTVNVKVTVGVQPDNDKYQPTAGEITKPYGTPTTSNDVTGKVSVPNFPKTGAQPVITVDTNNLPNGQTSGVFQVPVTVTYPDKTTDTVNVKVTVGPKDSDTYQPTTGSITKPYGQGTTEQEVKDKVTVPDFPKDKGTPTVKVDNPTQIPNGQTPGTVEVPVTVTYPDGTKDHVKVPVTVGEQPQKDKYEPTVQPITKPYGQGTTEQEVKDKVTVPDFPKDKGTPTIKVDNPAQIPNGQTPGTVEVPVTVTYPDGTKDHVKVPVTVGEQPQKDKYEPTVGEITKPYGTPTTAEEVQEKVSVPEFPKEKGTPVVTITDPTKLPNGQTSGVFQVPVTVTYPDKTTDTVNVKVTVGPKDSDTYEPTIQPIKKPFGQNTTEQEVKDKVTVPDFPTDKGTPTVKVDNPAQIPNGQTPGTVEVPVTVTYPDGTKDHVKVPVTVGEQPQKDKYEPTVQPITKPFGQGTTEQEVKDKVTVPDFPKDKGTPTIKVDNPTQIPNGQTPGTVEVPVTVTYPDGTKDHVNVPVTVGEQPQKDKYEPTIQPIKKPFGQNTTEQEVKDKVTVPDFPTDKGTPTVTVDNPAQIPNGQTPGTVDVPVTVTYPDGTKDHVKVPVTVGEQPQKDKYEPTAGEITKPYGTPTTEQEVKGKVNVPNFPKEGDQPVITVDTSKLPNGQISGETQVPVTVTYPDKTTDTVNVKVTVGPKNSETYQPATGEITKHFGEKATPDEVKSKVTVPGYPENGQPYTVSVDEAKIPDGQTPGEVEVPVTVTYPDNTTDIVNVKVTTGPKDSDTYEPTLQPIKKPFGQSTTEQEVKDKVTVPDFPNEKGTPTVTVDNPAQIPNGQTPGTVDVPVTVTYPDGTKDHVKVPVTVGDQPQKDKYEPTVQPIKKPFGQGTTEQEVKDKVTVPDFPKEKGTPTVTVDNPAQIPNGQTPGEVEVPVTVTYPDGTKDHVKVPVTVGEQPQKDKYEPTVQPIKKPFGQSTTEQEVKDKVTVPDFPKEKGTPTVTVDNPAQIPNGQTPGTVDIPVTVTYPDGTKDYVKVPVTVGDQPQNDKYEPTAGEITKPYGTPTTENEVKDKVSIPNFPKEGDQPVISVDTTKVPDGKTSGEFEVPVTVTYPDKTTDTVNVKVTVGPKNSDTYEPKFENITKPFGQNTTEQEVKDKVTVTVPDFPTDKGTPVVTVDDPTKIPNGQTSGVFDVPVTVTYPDKTTDKVTVKVTVGEQPDNVKYDPKAGEITKHFGEKATPDEVKSKVTVPGYPENSQPYTVTVDEAKIPDGQTPGEVEVPATVTYPDKTTDIVNVKVTTGPKDSDTYEPTTGEIKKPYGTPTTEEEIKGKVSVPDFPKEGDQPVITVDTSKVPDGQTSGEFEVPVTVTYPDKTTDVVKVKVTVGPKDSVTYEPTTQPIVKPFGTPTTADEVKGNVTIPNFPKEGTQPVITIDDETKVPNGQTPGVFDVPVTVTYPDKTTDKVTVKVTVGEQPDNVKYDPKAGEIVKHFGEKATPDEVKSKVTVPGYPENGQPYTVTVDETKIPDGQTPGEVEVPVTVTYPDKTTDIVNVKVTTGPKDSDTYEPTTQPITKPFGQGTTEQEVKDKVTVPNFSVDKGTPVVTVDDPTKLPDGNTHGVFDVPVTVTYPDKTTDKVTVKVTVGDQPQKDIYEPTTGEITKPYGTPTTEDEVKGKVSVPDFPKEGNQPVITVDTTKIPDGQTPGEFEVPVTVTYPDKTTDTVNVKVTVGPKDSDTYEPTVQPITKPFGQGTTEQEVKDKVIVPNFPVDKGTPVVTVDDPTKLPDGNTHGVFDVPVTVTYPDKTTDKVTVKVTVGDQPQKDIYEPTAEEIVKPYETPTTEDEVKGKVSVPDFPKEGDQPVITVDTTKIPDGQTPGEFEVQATVTYPDKTTDTVNVKVTVGPKDSDTYEPVTQSITKPYGQGTTEQEVKDKVTVPNFPADKGTPVVTVDDPTKVPNGQTPGEFEVPVTVTYPDGTKDRVTVKVTVTPQPQNDKYEPTAGEITKPYGTPTTADEVKGKVSIPDFPKEGDQPVITVDTTKVPDGNISGEFEVPVTITYPDKTTDVVKVKVTVGPKDADTYEPKFENITKPFGQGTTEQEVKDKVTVPNFPVDKGTPVVTVDDPTKLPDGNTHGVFDVPVTVTYPDKTTDKVTVKVTVGDQPQKDIYEPTAGEITKSYGSATTEEEVKGKVSVPGFPQEGDQPIITVDTTKVPDGKTSGKFEVPVTVTYPDKTTDTVNVKVTVGPKDSDTYEPKFENITKPYGQGTTEQEVKDKVTVPNFPADKGTPVVTVDDPTKLPDGNTHGVFDVPVTVTYPDGTKDHVVVKVTVGDQPENVKYDPKAGEVTKHYGETTTLDEVKEKVTVPGYPENGQPFTVTVDETKIPDGQTSGEFEVPVTVTYPDKTTDTVNVKVTIGPKDSDTYEPTVKPIEKPFGQGTTEQEVKDKVTVPNFPADKGTPVVTVDDSTKVPNGQTPGEFDVPVTVTYPDGTKDHVTVKVTVTPQPQNDKYEPVAGEITKPYGTPTTEDEVKGKVSVPDFPKEGDQPIITVDTTKVPDGKTSGEFEVPVTVTYPDKTTDTVNVKVTVGPKDSDTYEPTVQPIEKPFGQGTTEQEVKDKVTVPNFPVDKGTPVVTVEDPTNLPDGNTHGVFDVPVTVTYPDGTKDHVVVKVTVGDQPDNVKYDPKAGEVTKHYGETTTPDEVKGKVTVPGYPENVQPFTVTVDETKIPDGKTSGEFEVPVTVTYPDGTKDHVVVKVTVNPQPQNDKYEPTAGEITKPYGTATTEDEVKGKVSVPDFPADKGTPIVIVDDSTKVPNGQTPGTFDVPVTVTYPDGTKDYVTVKVTVNPQPQNDKYEPTAGEITKPYGTPTTPEEVKEKVSVPDFPKDGGKVVVTIDDPTTVPSGNASGVFEVPVTVTYPDGTKDHVTVKIVVTPKPENAKYEPVSKDIEKPYNQPTTVNEIVNQVTVPDYPTTGNQPKVTVDNPALIPDGKVPGEYEVPVTVTYPDGTKDHVTVKVVVTPQPENDKYEPVSKDIEKPYNQPTTVNEIVNQVTVPDYPTTGNQPKVTVDNPALIPDGKVPGEYEVPVTVTYRDGTKDHVSVKVVVGPKDSDVFEPVAGKVEKTYGTPTTIEDVVSKVTVPGYSKVDNPYKVTVDNPSVLPNGNTPGVYDVPVTVTYPDGSTDHVTVKVMVNPQPENDKYEPVSKDIEKPYNHPTTVNEIANQVTVPDYPTTGDQPKVTVDNPTLIPDGKVPGEYEVPVTVTYPDGTKDHVSVKVVIGPKASDTYEPTIQPIEKPYGSHTTIDEIVGKVTVPGYPDTENPYKVTVDNPTLIPSGSIPGVYDVPVTVTYPDGTTDHINVTITVHPQPDADVYNPGYNDVQVNPGESIEIPQVKDDVPTGTRFEIPSESGIDKDWTVTVNPDTGKITVTVPEDAAEGDVVTVIVKVTYPDGSTENVTVDVTVHDSIAPEAPVVNPIEAGDRTVTGTGKEPGSTVTVTFPDGSTVTTKVDKDGNWKVDVPEAVTLKDGDNVKAVITDEAGNVSKETVTPVKDTVAPEAPVVNVIHAGDKVVTGTAEPGTTVTVTFPNGTVVTVKVGQDGTWSVDVPSNVMLKDGDKVTVVATDEAGNISKSSTAIVVGDKEVVPAPNKEKINTPESGGTSTIDTNTTDTNNKSSKVGVSTVKDESSNKTADKSKAKSTAKALPDTGKDTVNSGVLFGGLFAALGSILLFRRRRNHDDNK